MSTFIRKNRHLLATLSAWAALLGCLAPAPASAAELLEVRFGASTAATRIVFDLSGAVDYAISGEDAGQGRLIIEFTGLSTSGMSAAGEGHVAAYAISSIGANRARAVLDLKKTAKVEAHFLLPPKDGVTKHRLVLDLKSADRAAFLASLPQRQYAVEELTNVLEAVAAAQEPASDKSDAWPIVVIDAGHGGADPGARGPGGTMEKTVTLAAAQQLAAVLEAKGRYRIVMTRADDTRLGLEDRSRAAREANAELFISLHADAHDNEKLRGGSVYTLSDEGGERSAREARSQGDYRLYGENINEAEPVVGGILFDLAQRNTQNASSVFAEKLLASLDGVTPLINNSHRTADLFVLLSPDVPAVLFELAFISNKSDEANLNSQSWREKTMTAVAEAIDAYFDAREPARHAASVTRRSP